MRVKESPWFHFTIEFGRYGFGRCREPVFPRQFDALIARVSFGGGGLDEGLLRAMRAQGRAQSVPNVAWRRWRLRDALNRLWLHMLEQLPLWLAIGCLSVLGALLVVALTVALGSGQ